MTWWLRACAAVLLAATAGCSDDARPRARGTGAAPAPATSPAGPTADPNEPTRRLTGTPLARPPDLRLLVAGDPPALVDLKREGSRLPAGLRALGPLVSVESVGGRTVALSACAECLSGDLLVLAEDGSGAKKIGTASHFVPALDGRAVWVWDQAPGERCTVRRISLAGGPATGRRAARCDRVLVAETPLGLLWADGPEGDESVIDSLGDGTEIFRARLVQTVVGRQVLSDPGADGPLRLTDTAAGTHVDISRPTTAAAQSQAMVAPDGRTLAISFDHPAWPGPRQRMDLWLLDLPTRTWRHAPAMPVHAALKKSRMAWTQDGRLMLLGSFDEVGDVLALWRPGDARWALREVDLPAHGASDFVVLAGG